MKLEKITRDFIKTLTEPQKKRTKAYDTKGIVTRIEEGIAWVKLAGSKIETPLQMTISAEPGDEVQARIGNGTGWLTGNGTAPPTDDRMAKVSYRAARRADEKAEAADAKATETEEELIRVRKTATQAKEIAADTNQYFWVTEEGTDTGTHITEVAQDSFTDPESEEYHSGGNLLARTNGIAIREGLSELATFDANGIEFFGEGGSIAEFGIDGARIGQTGGTRTEMRSNSLKLIANDVNGAYVDFSDLSADGYYEDEMIIDKDRDTLGWHWVVLDYVPISIDSIHVYYDGTEVSGFSLRNDVITRNVLDLGTNLPTDGQEVKVTYNTTDKRTKAYTLGYRKSGKRLGGMSLAVGDNVEASGRYSVAIGNEVTAEATGSFAQGYSSKASGPRSVALNDSFAKGTNSIAAGYVSHANGENSVAAGNMSTTAGRTSFAFGTFCTTSYEDQFAVGHFNDPSNQSYLFMVGNGSGIANENAMVVDWYGNTKIAGTLTQASDKRLKEHKSFLSDDAVKFIRKLRAACYTKDGEAHVGFYAQDVAEADPWNCMTGEMNGYMTLSYTELIAPLVAYCQHLEERVEKLEKGE